MREHSFILLPSKFNGYALVLLEQAGKLRPVDNLYENLSTLPES